MESSSFYRKVKEYVFAGIFEHICGNTQHFTLFWLKPKI